MMFKVFLVALALVASVSAGSVPKFSDEATTLCYDNVMAKVTAVQVPVSVEQLMEQILIDNDEVPINQLPVSVFCKYKRPSDCDNLHVKAFNDETCMGLDNQQMDEAMSAITSSQAFKHVIAASRVCDLTNLGDLCK